MKGKVSDHEESNAKVEFIKLNDKEILIRTSRNGDMFEATARVVPPEKRLGKESADS